MQREEAGEAIASDPGLRMPSLECGKTSLQRLPRSSDPRSNKLSDAGCSLRSVDKMMIEYM